MLLQYSTREARPLGRDTCATSLHGNSLGYQKYQWPVKAEFPTPTITCHTLICFVARSTEFLSNLTKNPINTNQPLGFCITFSMNNSSSLHESPKELQSPRELPKSPETSQTNGLNAHFRAAHLNPISILISSIPIYPILIWLPWFLHRWSRLHLRPLHLWRF